MADTPTVEEVADAMYELLVKYHGKKRYKAGDLQKEMRAKYGRKAIDRKMNKEAIKLLMDQERTIYGYAGGSWVEPVIKED